MKLVELSLKDFANALSAKESVPGGGSASAYVGSIAVSLLLMVARYNERIEMNKSIIEALEDEKNNLLSLVDKDALSFDEVMKAYRLPKNTDDEKKIREEQIQSTLREAANIPYDTLRTSSSAIKYMELLEPDCKKNMISDLACSALFLKSAIEGSYLNILINIKSIRDKEFADSLYKDATNIKTGAFKILDKIFFRIEQQLEINPS